MKIGESFEDGTASEALTFGLGTDGGYVLKNSQVKNSPLFWIIFKLILKWNFQ